MFFLIKIKLDDKGFKENITLKYKIYMSIIIVNLKYKMYISIIIKLKYKMKISII